MRIQSKQISEAFPSELHFVSNHKFIMDIFNRGYDENGESHYEGEDGSCINIWRDLCLLALTVCEGEENGL